MFEDNTLCIEWLNHVLGCRERAKHMDILRHFAHETVQNGHIGLNQIQTEHSQADLATTCLVGRCPVSSRAGASVCRPCMIVRAADGGYGSMAVRARRDRGGHTTLCFDVESPRLPSVGVARLVRVDARTPVVLMD